MLQRKPDYDDILLMMESDKTKLKYPERIHMLRDSMYFTQLDGIGRDQLDAFHESQEREVAKQQMLQNIANNMDIPLSQLRGIFEQYARPQVRFQDDDHDERIRQAQFEAMMHQEEMERLAQQNRELIAQQAADNLGGPPPPVDIARALVDAQQLLEQRRRDQASRDSIWQRAVSDAQQRDVDERQRLLDDRTWSAVGAMQLNQDIYRRAGARAEQRAAIPTTRDLEGERNLALNLAQAMQAQQPRRPQEFQIGTPRPGMKLTQSLMEKSRQGLKAVDERPDKVRRPRKTVKKERLEQDLAIMVDEGKKLAKAKKDAAKKVRQGLPAEVADEIEDGAKSPKVVVRIPKVKKSIQRSTAASSSGAAAEGPPKAKAKAAAKAAAKPKAAAKQSAAGRLRAAGFDRVVVDDSGRVLMEP